jgi:hypothetical protein
MSASGVNRAVFFKQPIDVEANHLSQVVEANDLSQVDNHSIELGKKLLGAFSDKSNPATMKALVEAGAPVNYRLSYGLEIKQEATFVAAFFLLLETEPGKALNNATFLSGGDSVNGQGLYNYVSTGKAFRDILWDATANQTVIPVAEGFQTYLEQHAINARFEPEPEPEDPQNGSLIIASGLRNTELVRQILEKGRSVHVPIEENGADVNFKGYFGDNAAVWSTILMDYDTLRVLLDNGSQSEHIGITQSSLLHWIAVVARLDISEAHQNHAIRITELLLARGCSDHPNIFNKKASDYAEGTIKEMLLSSQRPQCGL